MNLYIFVTGFFKRIYRGFFPQYDVFVVGLYPPFQHSLGPQIRKRLTIIGTILVV